MKTYYDILQVKTTSSVDEIKSSFRKLAKIYHPDNNSSEEFKNIFQQINEAQEVLSNQEKREKYDIFLNIYKRNLLNDFEIKYKNSRDFHKDWSNILSVYNFKKNKNIDQIDNMNEYYNSEEISKGNEIDIKLNNNFKKSEYENLNNANDEIDLKVYKKYPKLLLLIPFIFVFNPAYFALLIYYLLH